MKKVVKAVVVLTAFSLVDRVLGFLFKIYLSNELGAVSLGIYQIALSVFFVLLTLTTSGVPLIVSKLTAHYQIKKNFKSEHSLVSAALIIGTAVSCAVCAVFLIFSKPMSGLFATGQSMKLLLLMLPGVVFSGIYAAFRGNMWGRQRFKTVSLIEVLEQIFRIIVCVMLFSFGLNKLEVTAISMSAACGFTAVACILSYFAGRGRLANPKGFIAPLLKQSAPITMIRASNSIVNSLVAISVPFLLKAQGLSVAESLYIYGSSVGMAFPLLYIPITVVGSLAYVLIPTLSSAIAKGDKEGLRKQIETAITFSAIAGAVFIPVFFALGKEIGMFVYNGNIDSGLFLQKSAWLLIPMSVESITSSMMNSLDLEKSSFFNYTIGSAVLFAVMFSFYFNFNINILIIGLALSWTVSSILDIYKVKKKTGIRLSFVLPLVKASALVFPSAFLARTLYNLIDFMPAVLSLGLSSLAALAFFAAAGLVFGLFDFSKGMLKTGNKPKPAKAKNTKAVKPAHTKG